MRKANTKDLSKWVLYAVIGAFGLYMLWLNIISPLLTGDDFIFSLKIPKDGVIGSERIGSISDLIESQINFYKNYHYRIINHTILQIILLLPTIVFDVLNTLVFLLLPWVLLKIKSNQTPIQYLSKYVVLLLFIWIFHFSLGWCYFPVTGALNYTWMLIPQLWFVTLILQYRDGHHHRWSLIILALANSMANENVCVSLFVLTVWILWETRDRKESTLYICLVIMVIGGLIMLSSPSIGKRLATQGHRDAGLLQHVLEYGRRVIYYCIRYSPILLLLFIGGKQKIQVRSKELLLLTVFIIATGIMIIVPLFEPRSAVFGFFILLMIALSLTENHIVKPITLVILCSITLYLCITRTPAFISLKSKYDANHNLLIENKGAALLKINKYCGVTTHDYILCHEISEDPNYFDNKTVAAYYNIKQVTLKDDFILNKQRETVFSSIKANVHFLSDYDSIQIDPTTNLFHKNSDQGLELIIRKYGLDVDHSFYIFRAYRRGLLKHQLATLFPLGIQVYFLDYTEDLTERSQQKLYDNNYSYNYNYISNPDQYKYILMANYSFDKHAVEGDIFKLILSED